MHQSRKVYLFFLNIYSLVLCWANVFDIDPALNYYHIEYNYWMYFFYLHSRCALVVMQVIISQLARGVDLVCWLISIDAVLGQRLVFALIFFIVQGY